MIGIANRSRSAAAVLLAVVALTSCKRSGGGYPDFADLVERASPSVVNISTVTDRPSLQGQAAPEGLEQTPEWFRRFLEEHGNTEPEEPDSEEEGPNQPQSLGSGFVLWEDGYILTNYHVVRDAKEVVVRLLDRRQLTAQVVGSDERSDLALLKIDATGLPAVKLGDSSKLRPGQWVLAIGSPFGFDYSVTAGIVSAKGRSLATEQYVPFIQTDVAINPGNSGGPLFNLDGEVVGINSQIYSQSGGYQGLSFAVPMDVAAKVARQLKDKGRVSRGWLGVVVRDVTRDMAKGLGVDKPEGALVAKVMDNSPAQEAGIKEGDLILSFNGETLANSGSLPPLVGNVDPGELVTLLVVREGRRIEFKVEIAVLENQDAESEPAPEVSRAEKQAPLGLVVSSLSDEQRRERQVLSGGVEVLEVRGGPAAKAGIRPGDVLLSIAGQEIDTPERLAEVASRLTPGTSVPVLVSRNGNPSFRPLDVPLSAPE
jgi:serine protease Do